MLASGPRLLEMAQPAPQLPPAILPGWNEGERRRMAQSGSSPSDDGTSDAAEQEATEFPEADMDQRAT
eukprot:15485842-Alexandrium_andersonii.AAC.1